MKISAYRELFITNKIYQRGMLSPLVGPLVINWVKTKIYHSIEVGGDTETLKELLSRIYRED